MSPEREETGKDSVSRDQPGFSQGLPASSPEDRRFVVHHQGGGDTPGGSRDPLQRAALHDSFTSFLASPVS